MSKSPEMGGSAKEVSCEEWSPPPPAAPLRLLRPPGELVTSAGEPPRDAPKPRPSEMARRPACRCGSHTHGAGQT